jgi:DNA-binding NtrC family response regulator
LAEASRPESPIRILVADDDLDVRRALHLLLKAEGFEVEEAGSPEEALVLLGAQPFDVALLDLNYARNTTSGREGLALLRRLRERNAALSVVVMTAWGSVPSAVEAMRLGARDYVEKPWNNERLLTTLRTHAALTRAQRRDAHDEGAGERGLTAPPPLVAESAGMQAVRDLLERIANSDASVLILGEHGSGKEVVARWIHAASDRAAKPLVTLNAGGLADGVFESECFGHVKGAFTDAKQDRAGCFELADGGTLFLDEIGNMPLGQQAKLLRVLETGELQRVGSSRSIRVDVRVLAATNAELDQAVAENRFRPDLLYRLNTVEVEIPPLRDRREDVPALAEHFLHYNARRYQRAGLEFAPEAVQALVEHDWPGNVRELNHVVERAVLLARDRTIDVESLMLRRGAASGVVSREPIPLAEAERRLVESTLERAGGNVTEAAALLGLSRSALYRRLERMRKG